VSEPWLRIYAAEMRADPKIGMLTLQEQALLPHAWDLAKNDTTVLGELRMVDGTPMTARFFARLIPGATPRLAEKFMRRLVECGLAEKLDDGALRFPTLGRRQAIDRTNALRQARFRQRQRNGKSNTPNNGTELDEEEEVPLTPAQRGDDVVKSNGHDHRRAGGANPRSRGTNPRSEAKRGKRAKAVVACRRVWEQGVAEGENRDALRESLEREYRHDPSIVTEAIAVPA
jgi:hypothetical protein